MCRLALFNRAFLEASGSDVLGHFWDLETAMGGDGNGVACLLSDGTSLVEKGLSFNPNDCHETLLLWLKSTDADWFVFHTRLATSGGKSDKMCHPFKENGMLLAHNGVCAGYAGFKLMGREVSDTRFLLHVATTYTDNPLKTLYDASGVFIGFHNNAPFLVKASAHSDLRVLLSGHDMGVCVTSDWYQPIPAGYEMWLAKVGTCADVTNLPELHKMLTSKVTHPSLKRYISPKEHALLSKADAAQYYLVQGQGKNGPYSYYAKSATPYKWTNGATTTTSTGEGHSYDWH